MNVTLLDRNLLQRVIKILREDAASLVPPAGVPWGTDADSKRDKTTHDRLCREVRDLEALRDRVALALKAGDAPDEQPILPTGQRATVNPAEATGNG